MNVVDLRPDLRMVLDKGPGQAYLLRRGPEAVLIDTGIAGQAAAIAEALRDWGLDRESLTHVVLTHWHPDHAGSAAELAAWPNVQIWAHHSDAPIIRGDSHGSFPALTHTEEGIYAQIAGTVPDAPHSRVDRELGDNEVLDAIGARILSVPGHTDGSIALHFPDRAVLFTGDIATAQQGHVTLGPFNHNREQARESFRRFADIDVDTVCFGHGEPLLGDDTTKLRAAATAKEVPEPPRLARDSLSAAPQLECEREDQAGTTHRSASCRPTRWFRPSSSRACRSSGARGSSEIGSRPTGTRRRRKVAGWLN